MSTCNFRQPTLSRIYASELEDDWAWDDLKNNVGYGLEEKIKNFTRYTAENYGEKWLDNTTLVIGDVDLEVYNKDYKEWETKTIYVTIEGGYYSGAMIDVSLHEFEELPEINKTLAKKIDSICFQIEKVLTDITTPVTRVAVFNNGEAVYQKAEGRPLLKAIAMGLA